MNVLDFFSSLTGKKNKAKPLAGSGFDFQGSELEDKPYSPLRSEIFTRDRLVQHAHNLAHGHKVTAGRKAGKNIHFRFEENCRVVEEAYFYSARAAKNKDQLTPGVEWLLDNYHVVEKHVRDIRKHLPKGYYKSLPKLSEGKLAGFPRVYHLALEYLAHTDAFVERDSLAAFIEAYQTRSVLSIGELWAVPIMLRLALIENLRRLVESNMTMEDEKGRIDILLDEIFKDKTKQATDILLLLTRKLKDSHRFFVPLAVHVIWKLRSKGKRATLALQWFEERLREKDHDAEELIRAEHHIEAANQISIGNTVSSLKTVDSLNWRNWFERVSEVESELRKDPAGIHQQSDFKTRDMYRQKIESLALRLAKTETEVAREAVLFAESARSQLLSEEKNSLSENLRLFHVGYYLIGKGSAEFERNLGYKPPLVSGLLKSLLSRAFPLYISAIALITILFVGYVVLYALDYGAGSFIAAGLVFLLLIPASDLSNNIVQWLVTHITTPFLLAKKEFKGRVPDDCRTIITVHTIFKDKEAIRKAIELLEVRFLGNEDPNISFALLADLHDANQEVLPQDKELITYAADLMRGLNEKYLPDQSERFYLLFRKRQWNASEGRYMGWERKRGKVMEFNSLLSGSTDTSFTVHVGDRSALTGTAYVITLDVDTQLPRGTAKKLIAAISHPLNEPVFDEQKNIVVEGYSVIQPRVGVALTSANKSRFSRIFTGHSGLDPYTQTISDVYQDLFQEGSYVGKAIYNVAAFERALKDRVPENALLSHDLFEGVFSRVALATDIELFDEFPGRYDVYAKRQHRWVRGDWQLIRWIGRYVPDKDGKSYRNPISYLGLWKLVDNLRRSLLAPACFLVLWLAWLILPGSPAVWSLIILTVIAFPVYANLANVLLIPPLGLSMSSYVKGVGKDFIKNSQQALYAVSFLAYQAFSMLHAITITLYRVYISKTHLLEWETAYYSERSLKGDLRGFISQMAPALLLTLIVLLSLVLFNPVSLWYATPFILLWLISPALAYYASKPFVPSSQKISSEDKDYLSQIAWDTWAYFEDHITEERNYLVPDNLQLVPKRVVAERASPTNISLSLTSIISAYDFGYIPAASVVEHFERIIKTLVRLEKFNGHFLNWYDVNTMEPLLPRYISTVDNGNMVGHFIAAREALLEFKHAPLLKEQHKAHIAAALSQLSDCASELNENLIYRISALQHRQKEQAGTYIDSLELIDGLRELLSESEEIFSKLSDKALKSFKQLQRFVELNRYFLWYAQANVFSKLVEKVLDDVVPSEKVSSSLKASMQSLRRILGARNPTLPLMLAVHNRLRNLHKELNSAIENDSSEEVSQLRHSANEFRKLVEESDNNIRETLKWIDTIEDQIARMIKEMDFSFLFDQEKKLFVIGYNVDSAKRDSSYYDLLASEARLASLVAIAKGDVPQRHWFMLGRTLTDTPGGKALLSWSGTMFEYLMPLLVTKDFDGTILSETSRAVVRAQIAYARRQGIAWGMSESAYSGVDFEKTYQYRAFGVPGLGLKRGLSEDLVVSPYSSFLALLVDANASIANIKRLEAEGLRGEYGFYEAVDYTPERLASDENGHIVKSFLAHHQGMILLALNNFLNKGIVQERFHRDPTIQSIELLLHERFPDRIPAIVPHQAELSAIERKSEEEKSSRFESYQTPHTREPRTRILSNSRYSVVIDNAGSGHSFFEGQTSATRWREDALNNNYGQYLFIKDLESGQIWSATYQPTRVEPEVYEVIFNPDKVEFIRRDFGIGVHTEITVSPEDNVEIRKVTITNFSGRTRKLEITSYAEVALGNTAADLAHPAFSKLFIQSEYIPTSDALLFSRRRRSETEEELYLFHMLTMKVVWEKTQYETSRLNFLGRGRNVQSPLALGQNNLSNTIGPVLDPIFSLRTKVEIEPGESEFAIFSTGVAKDRGEVSYLMERYHELGSVSRAFEMSWSHSNIELRHEQFTIAQAHSFQHLENALRFNIEEFRADQEVIKRNHLTQSGFWRFGISGDLPIVLLRVNDAEQINLVREMILAHEYLRWRGVTFDLVILNEYPGGYYKHFQEDLESLLRSGYATSVAEKSGGLYLRTLQQLSREEVDLMQAVARVVLKGNRGSLTDQLSLSVLKPKDRRSLGRGTFSYLRRDPSFKAFEPEKAEYEFFNGIGGFVEDGKAYQMEVTSNSLSPLPWSNVIANRNFGFLTTESGSGYSWSGNSRENRLTPWSNDPVSDPSGEIVYIRDAGTGSFWCPTPLPVETNETVVVKHSFGKSVFTSSHKGIHSELTLSGAREAKVKWWSLKLKNESGIERELEIYLYIEWVLGVFRNKSSPHLVTDFDRTSKTLFAINRYNNEFAGRVVFLGSSQEIHSYTCSRSEFLGRNKDASSPLFLEEAVITSLTRGMDSSTLSGKTGAGFDSSGVLSVILKLDANEEREVQFYMAEADSTEEMKSCAQQYSRLDYRKSELAQTEAAWKDLIEHIQVETPERSFDVMMNGWLLYQNISCRLFGRTGFYQSGGAFGFRDQLQDVGALLLNDPQTARKQILLHASRQFIEGDVQHWWHPPSGKGVRTKITDDYLWLPYLVDEYVTVTGDNSILDETVSFIEGHALENDEMEAYIEPRTSSHQATIYEHCIIAIDRCLKFGDHGLPFIGAGDWNDGMNKIGEQGKGESVWLGWFIYDILNRFEKYVASKKDQYRRNHYAETAKSLLAAIEENGWDGNWYRRAFFDDGTPLGSSENDECKIDSLSQSWSVISGGGQETRSRQAMEQVYNKLVDKENSLIKVLTPPFDKTELEPGYIKGYLPGTRENGGQYTHAAAWVIMAMALSGQGNKAFELFSLINPILLTQNKEGANKYKAEPYVTCGDVYSSAPHGGRAGWSWYTGSAGWLYRVGLEHMLGLKVSADHFQIKPCIPAEWKTFSLKYKASSCTFEINVENPQSVESGVVSVKVDGKAIEDQKIRFKDYTGAVRVNVLLGMPR